MLELGEHGPEHARQVNHLGCAHIPKLARWRGGYVWVGNGAGEADRCGATKCSETDTIRTCSCSTSSIVSRTSTRRNRHDGAWPVENAPAPGGRSLRWRSVRPPWQGYTMAQKVLCTYGRDTHLGEAGECANLGILRNEYPVIKSIIQLCRPNSL